MGAAKKAAGDSSLNPPSVVSVLQWMIGPGRTTMLAAIVLALFAGGWYAAWQSVHEDVLGSPSYRLTSDQLEITPLPGWIHSDVRSEVYRNASLEGPLSVLNPDLTERLRSEFLMHPWVARVERVQKFHPARVVVELVYRRPVCMVETAVGLAPIDEEGVVLPDADFSPIEKIRYPRLAGLESSPPGAVGSRWGDSRVIGGAEIAGVLATLWEKLEFDRIVPSAMPEGSRLVDLTFELYTKRGSWLFWGRSPNTELTNEVPVADKLARLERYVAEHGTLEGPNGPQQFDLTRPQALWVGPRTAVRPRNFAR